MTKQFIQTIFFLTPFFSNGQISQDGLKVYDTVKVYKCSYSIIQDGDSTYYKIDGKLVTKKECEKVLKGFREKKKCNPCFLKQMNLDGSPESQGVFYYKCPGYDEKSEIRTTAKDNERVYIQSSSCNDGEWLYYSKNGELKEIKYFDHGQETKTKSRLTQ